jgi:low affinity Fe/Cu permease
VTIRAAFRVMASATASAVGSPYAFILAVFVVAVWVALGPVFHYSDTWQLVINTTTTIITFLVVFMIQNTQNRDSRAIHLKLDELIRAVDAARNRMVDLEDLPDEELARLAQEFRRLGGRSEQGGRPRPGSDAGTHPRGH